MDVYNIVLYLRRIGIKIDRKEFEFQFNCHPDYPSLLAVTDTLKFFNVTNNVFRLSQSEISLLPNNYIVKLTVNHESILSAVSRKENIYEYVHNKKIHRVNLEGLREIWDDIVLLAESGGITIKKGKKRSAPYLLFATIILMLVIIMLHFSSSSLWHLLFIVLPVIGLLFSIASLKNLFGVNNRILNYMCNISPNSSCDEVTESRNWSIFKKISFSDLRTNVSGTNLCHYSNGQWYLVDYSYDIQRVDENGQSFTTYHGFTNWRHALEDC